MVIREPHSCVAVTAARATTLRARRTTWLQPSLGHRGPQPQHPRAPHLVAGFGQWGPPAGGRGGDGERGPHPYSAGPSVSCRELAESSLSLLLGSGSVPLPGLVCRPVGSCGHRAPAPSRSHPIMCVLFPLGPCPRDRVQHTDSVTVHGCHPVSRQTRQLSLSSGKGCVRCSPQSWSPAAAPMLSGRGEAD
ncbi:hypothetical protein AAY473_013743 [Plecturocebus cupreus]